MTPIPENALPNYDKRTIGDPAAFFRTLFHLRDIKEERAIPAVVKDYDAKTGEVTVIPMAKYTFDTRDGEAEVDRETVKVRVLKICQGGFSISLPIFKGDTGWLIAGDRRCGEAIKKNGEILVRDLTEEELKDRTSKPDDYSLLCFDNGFFLPFSWELEDAEKNPNGNYVIRNVRDKIGEKELENEFGVVRDDEGKDVPFLMDVNGKTHSIDGRYHGQYAWSMIELEKSGIVNCYGQGSKFTIRSEGLYINDKLTFTHGNGINTIIGNTEDSVPIAGDIEIVGDNDNVEIKTEIVEDSSESSTKKSRMTIKVIGGGSGTPINDATASVETLAPESDATTEVEWDEESKTLNFSFGIPRGAKGDPGTDGDTILSISSGTPTVSGENTITPITVVMSKSGQKSFTVIAKNGAAGNPDKDFSWEGTVIAKIAATAAISIDSKSIVGSGGITVTEANRIITISGNGTQVSGYTTPEGTSDYEVTGLEWDTENHRIVIHKVGKTYENGLLKTRESVTDEYIQFVEETA